MLKKMIITMKPALAQLSPSECDSIRAELVEVAPSVQIVGSINFSTRIIIEESEIDRLQDGLKDRFVVEADYQLKAL